MCSILYCVCLSCLHNSQQDNNSVVPSVLSFCPCIPTHGRSAAVIIFVCATRRGVHGLLKLPCICDVLLLLYIVLYMHTRYIIYVHRSRTYSISIYSSSRSSIYAVQMVTTIGGSGIAHLVSLRSQLVLLDVREFLNYGHHQISGVSFLKVSGALCKKI